MNNQLKIGIIGQQCSGKTTVANMICHMFRRPRIIKFADPIYDTLKALRQEKHRGFMQAFGEMAKVHFGEHIFVDIFNKKLEGFEFSGADLLICDDIRRTYEAQAAKEAGFKIIYIKCNRETRLGRAQSQGLEFIENHISETEVPDLEIYADYVLFNEGIFQTGLSGVVSGLIESIK